MPLLSLLLVACTTTTTPPALDYLISAEEVRLGVVSHEVATDAMPTAAVTVQNNMAVTLTLAASQVVGTPEDVVVLKAEASAEALVQIEPGQTGSVYVGVSGTRMSTWDEGEYQWSLPLVLTADVPTDAVGLTDTATYGPATTRISEEKTVPVFLEIDCDIDGDGVEAEACEASDGDCDDHSTAVFGASNGEAGHAESCDGLDNDCNGVADDAASGCANDTGG